MKVCWPVRSDALPVEPNALWDAWLPKEREFRARRLDVETLTPSQPFETYTKVWTDCFRRAFNEMGLQGDPDAATALCLADFVHRPPFLETLEVLAQLKGRWRLAILSNADDSYLYPLLERHGLAEVFGTILSSEEAGAYKPHPSIFNALLERLDVEPSETLMVGDTLHEDVWGSHLAGMPSAWVNRHGLPMDGRVAPTYELYSLKDLVTVLNGAERASTGK